MTCNKKYFFIIPIYCLIAYSHAMSSEYMLEKDMPYPDLPIVVPHALWKKAMPKIDQTPVLKSPVTIVVPVYVPPDENDDDYIVNEPDNVTAADQVVEVTTPAVNDELVQDTVVANNTVQADVTPVQNIQEDVIATTPAPVTGSLIRFPCSCISGQCGCCTGAILERFQTKACGNITFIAEDFLFDVKLSINNNTMVRRRVSASDPPPICFNPRRAPFVTVCAELSNIRIRNRNAFACLDINADIGGFPIYSASFRCFGLGTSGVQTGLKPKPVKSPGPAPVSLFNSNNDDDDDDDGILGGGIFGGGLDDGDGGILGGDGLFGGGSDDGDDDGGPLDAIGDAVGDFLDGRSID